MKFHSVTFKKTSSAYIVPIGDIHLGSTAFGERGRALLTGYLEWVKENKNARIFLMGDIFDVATRTSPTSPFESSSSEYARGVELFKPYAKQIIGAIRGNHCQRLLNFAGYDPMERFCETLGVPYFGLSAVVRCEVGKEHYYGYFHHSTGGGGTLGSALNRAVKLQDIVQGVDFYCIGHNHQLVNGARVVYHPNTAGTAIEERRIWYIDCGSFLDYPESYAEQMMLSPGKLGSPRIRLNGTKHDVHVSM
jgi:hypothetical protein